MNSVSKAASVLIAPAVALVAMGNLALAQAGEDPVRRQAEELAHEASKKFGEVLEGQTPAAPAPGGPERSQRDDRSLNFLLYWLDFSEHEYRGLLRRLALEGARRGWDPGTVGWLKRSSQEFQELMRKLAAAGALARKREAVAASGRGGPGTAPEPAPSSNLGARSSPDSSANPAASAGLAAAPSSPPNALVAPTPGAAPGSDPDAGSQGASAPADPKPPAAPPPGALSPLPPPPPTPGVGEPRPAEAGDLAAAAVERSRRPDTAAPDRDAVEAQHPFAGAEAAEPPGQLAAAIAAPKPAPPEPPQEPAGRQRLEPELKEGAAPSKVDQEKQSLAAKEADADTTAPQAKPPGAPAPDPPLSPAVAERGSNPAT